MESHNYSPVFLGQGSSDLCRNFKGIDLDLDVLRAQRLIGFFFLITHKSTGSNIPITWSTVHMNISVDSFLQSAHQMCSTLAPRSLPSSALRFTGMDHINAVLYTKRSAPSANISFKLLTTTSCSD